MAKEGKWCLGKMPDFFRPKTCSSILYKLIQWLQSLRIRGKYNAKGAAITERRTKISACNKWTRKKQAKTVLRNIYIYIYI